MSEIKELRSKIMEIIKDDNYDMSDLKEILDPVFIYIDNPLFRGSIEQIVDLLTEDRNGDVKFTIDDLGLFCRDLEAVTALFQCLLLAIQAIPDMKMNYDGSSVEKVMFKLLVYICLVMIPKKTNTKWSYDEKVRILDLSISVYKMIQSTGIIKDLFDYVYKLLKNKVFVCKCLSPSPETKIERNMPQAKKRLICAMNNVRDKSELISKVQTEIKMEMKK